MEHVKALGLKAGLLAWLGCQMMEVQAHAADAGAPAQPIADLLPWICATGRIWPGARKGVQEVLPQVLTLLVPCLSRLWTEMTGDQDETACDDCLPWQRPGEEHVVETWCEVKGGLQAAESQMGGQRSVPAAEGWEGKEVRGETTAQRHLLCWTMRQWKGPGNHWIAVVHQIDHACEQQPRDDTATGCRIFGAASCAEAAGCALEPCGGGHLGKRAGMLPLCRRACCGSSPMSNEGRDPCE